MSKSSYQNLDHCLKAVGIFRKPEPWHRRLAAHVPPVVVANKMFYGIFDGMTLDLFYIDRNNTLNRWHDEIILALGKVEMVGYIPEKKPPS